MRAKLPPLVGVQPALEQRAQDGRLHLRPVEQRRLVHRPQLLAREGQHLRAVEQAPVEPLHPLVAEVAPRFALRHPPEQLGQAPRELLRIGAPRLDHPGQDALRQQAHILGEEAEQHAVEEVRDRLGVVAAIMHRARDPGEAGGRGPRHLVGRLPRPQRRRLGHHRAQHAQRLRRALPAGGQVVERHAVDAGPGVGEVGVDLDAVHVAHHQQGRILQRLAVVEQLAIGGRQVAARPLVLPAEVAPLPDVGPALAAARPRRPRLERVAPPRRVRLVGRRHAQQPAEVDEVLLRRGALASGVLTPLGHEGLDVDRGASHRSPAGRTG